MKLGITAISVAMIGAMLSLQGCFTTSKIMTHEEAIEKDTKDQIYNEKFSLARNICGYMQIFCPKDVEVTQEQFNELRGGTDNNNTGIEISKLGGVMVASSALFPTSFAQSTHQMGAGWFFLGSGLVLAALKPSDWKYSRVLAFVPVSKAKTAEEARAYFMKVMAKAENRVIKENKLEVLKTDSNTVEREDHTTTYRDVHVKGKDDCPVTEKGEARCLFMASVIHGGINEVKTVIPSWLPNGGQEAWRISRTGPIFTATPYRYSKVVAKDMIAQIVKYLPDDFYVYVPATDGGDGIHEAPAFIMSNKQVYPFMKIKKKGLFW